MLLDGGEADLVVAQPRESGGMLPQDLYIHALKSILVHSETNIIY